MPAWILALWANRKIVAVIGAGALLFIGGYETRVKIDAANQAIQLADEAAAQKKAQDEANAKATAWEKQLAGLRAENKKLTGRLSHETKAPIYTSCVVPDSGVQLFNDALTGGTTAKPDGGMH